MHKLDYWFLYDIHNKNHAVYTENAYLSYRLMTMIINTKKNSDWMRLIAVNAGAVSQKLDKTRAGVLTNRPERANELHEDIWMIFCPT